jgi:hypothetical protein
MLWVTTVGYWCSALALVTEGVTVTTQAQPGPSPGRLSAQPRCLRPARSCQCCEATLPPLARRLRLGGWSLLTFCGSGRAASATGRLCTRAPMEIHLLYGPLGPSLAVPVTFRHTAVPDCENESATVGCAACAH